jgi:hypothetical protein
VSAGPEARVRRLVEGARRIADPADDLGQRARAVLPGATGLTPEGVELALRECLETSPSDAEIRALVASVPLAERAHVVLSANVFVAAHRAIALALASAADVRVRPSRREPRMAELLREAAPGLFAVVASLDPAPGDHVWAYGADESLLEIRRALPPSVVLHAHGAGVGVVLIALEDGDPRWEACARGVARDVVPFDQRGCASPRLVVARGSVGAVRSFAAHVARELAALEAEVPRGRLHPEELAQVTRYRDTMRFAGELFEAGCGFVGLDPEGASIVVSPVGRNVHVVRAPDPPTFAAPLAPLVTAAAIIGPADFVHAARTRFLRARFAEPGRMQRPPFDGPVDRRDAETLHSPS